MEMLLPQCHFTSKKNLTISVILKSEQNYRITEVFKKYDVIHLKRTYKPYVGQNNGLRLLGIPLDKRGCQGNERNRSEKREKNGAFYCPRHKHTLGI